MRSNIRELLWTEQTSEQMQDSNSVEISNNDEIMFDVSLIDGISSLIHCLDADKQRQAVYELYELQQQAIHLKKEDLLNGQMIKLGLIPKLIEFMSINNINLTQSIAVILLNFSSLREGQVQHLIQANIVPFLATIFPTVNDVVRLSICSIVRNIEGYHQSTVQQFMATLPAQVIEGYEKEGIDRQRKEIAVRCHILIMVLQFQKNSQNIMTRFCVLLDQLAKNEDLDSNVKEVFKDIMLNHILQSLSEEFLQENNVLALLMRYVHIPQLSSCCTEFIDYVIIKLIQHITWQQLKDLNIFSMVQSLLVRQQGQTLQNLIQILSNLCINVKKCADELLKVENIINALIYMTINPKINNQIFGLFMLIIQFSTDRDEASKFIVKAPILVLLMQKIRNNDQFFVYEFTRFLKRYIICFNQLHADNQITNEQQKLIKEGLIKILRVSRWEIQMEIADFLKVNFGLIIEVIRMEDQQ